MKYAADLYFDRFCSNSDSCCGVCYKDRSMDYFDSRNILQKCPMFTKYTENHSLDEAARN